MANKPTIGISVGDINGIGMEVMIRAFENSTLLEVCTPVIYGSSKLFSYYKKLLESEINFNGIDHIGGVIPGKINVLNIWKDVANIEPGKETQEGGLYAFKSLQASVDALAKGEIEALVTLPINKNNIQSEEFKFPGHTEYLAQRLGGEALMFLVSDDLKIGVITGHIALEEVAKNITAELIEKRVNQVEESLKKDFAIQKPKIAILGIDPHTGDNGVIGTKDRDVVVPAIRRLFDKGKFVFGPYSSDGFFGNNQYRNFDAVLAMYHDQGLIPFKTIVFEQGVNFTAGLSKVRTSPDHGTAYDLVGKGIANSESLRHAIYDAIDIVKNRVQYAALTSNVLKSYRDTIGDNNHDEDIDAKDIAE